MLAKWDPFRDLLSVEDEFERLLGRPSARMAWAPASTSVRPAASVTVDLPVESDDVTGRSKAAC
jgi:hypothetical protein